MGDAYLLFILAVFLCFWVWSAIKPLKPKAWFLENFLVFLMVPILVYSSNFFRLSLLSYSAIALFLILHVIGSHFTYTKTPFGKVVGKLFGSKRNMYDRLVHFSYGFLLSLPLLEFFSFFGIDGWLVYYLPLEFILATSAIYELIEWVVAVRVDKHAGTAFLGSQGDSWDAQKDIFVAFLGSVIAVLLILIL